MKLIKWPQNVHEGQGQNTYHWCPGCERLHVLPDGWTRTGPDEAPTYTPSFLQHSVRGQGNNCHYFITAGVIRYQADSWHTLRGDVPMPDIPGHVVARLTEEVFK